MEVINDNGCSLIKDLNPRTNIKILESNKNCDWLISNDVSDPKIGFNSDYNEVTIFYKDKNLKDEKLFLKKQSEISDEIIERVISQLN